MITLFKQWLVVKRAKRILKRKRDWHDEILSLAYKINCMLNDYLLNKKSQL
jgi:hypothetical protein